MEQNIAAAVLLSRSAERYLEHVADATKTRPQAVQISCLMTGSKILNIAEFARNHDWVKSRYSRGGLTPQDLAARLGYALGDTLFATSPSDGFDDHLEAACRAYVEAAELSRRRGQDVPRS